MATVRVEKHYDMAYIDQMEGHEFESFIADLLRELGYQKVKITSGSGDQGADILAERDGVRYAVQCKRHSSDLGNTPVQEVHTGKDFYHCHVGVVATNRYFTQSAHEAAKATGVLLWDRDKLEELIAKAFNWSNVVAIATGDYYTVGLKIDGTVVVMGADLGSTRTRPYDVSSWNNIVEISAGTYNIVGLKADGTVVTAGIYSENKCDVSDWSNIVKIAAGTYHIIGLKADGTVVAVGENSDGQCNVSSWNNIVAIAAGAFHTVGLKADGTIVAVGRNSFGQCKGKDW